MDELQKILQELRDNSLDKPNLQVDKIQISISGYGVTVTGTTQTKNEFKKVRGVVLVQETADNKAMLTIDIAGKNVVGRDSFHARLIAVKDYIPAKKSAWIINQDVKNSTINYSYVDGRSSGGAINAYIYLICEQ